VGIYEVASVMYVVGTLVSGRFVNRFGAKRLAVLSTLLAAFFTIGFFFIPNLWVAFTFDMLHVWFAAFATPPFVYLVLEQIPKSCGTMMALNSLFNNIGNAVAPALGGALLAFTSGIYRCCRTCTWKHDYYRSSHSHPVSPRYNQRTG
jgi:MFS family permease